MRAKNYIREALYQVVEDLGLSWSEKISVERPKEDKFGDMATNAAMVLAKTAGEKPFDLAENIKQQVLASYAQIENIEVAGPGFLNFFFYPGFWQQTCFDVLQGEESYGSLNYGQDNSVLIEYVSANPTGPLHIGHGRGAAVGDSLSRILRFAGYDVKTEYYVNDVGRQVFILGKSVWVRYQQLLEMDAALDEQSYKGDYIWEIAKQVLRLYGRDLLREEESRAIEICRDIALEHILGGIKRDLQEFRTQHENWFSEQELVEKKLVNESLDFLTQKGYAYEQEGALWFKSSSLGDDKDRVLRKSDCELTYFASDVAYHKEKFQRGFDMLIDVWGADHHGYVPRIKAAVQAMGYAKESLQMILIQLVNLVRNGEYVSMSTREGDFETLSDVCAEVGVDAARFIFLSRKSDSHLDFDLDLLKRKSMDNPVYYVQYAYARICSVYKKAEERGVALDAATPEILACLNTREDMELLKSMERFPEVVEAAAKNLSPHFITYYLQDLAGMLHRYYNKHQVLNTGDLSLEQARMYMMLCVARVLGNGLTLLGVSAPETM